MSRMTLIAPFLSGLLILSSCAESAHQVRQDDLYTDVPPELEQQIDTSVAFADLHGAPANYVGRIVMAGGVVISAKRTKDQTEIEILELPAKERGPSTTARLRSQGRFLAVREEFLDPASVPAGTPITVIGVVKGSATKPLDESEYTYPVLEIKHLIDWNTVASQKLGGNAAFYGPYYPPYAYWWGPYGYSPYFGAPYGYYPYFRRHSPLFIRPHPSSPPPPRPQNIPPRFRKR